MERDWLPVGSLTRREQEILQLVALGLSNREIAEELVVALETVHWYTKQIYSKLGVSGRIQAVNRARELGLLQVETAPQALIPVPKAGAQKHNLPAPTTPLIGRVREISELRRLLQTARLLTLTGVGGSGKTRLALQVASQVLDNFADGVYFVDLAPLSDHSLVTKTIAAVLGMIENPAEPVFETLKRALADRGLLLVLDNFEHVIEVAPLVSELLAGAAGVKALVTSREALRLSGEQEFSVPPLSIPPTETISIQNVTESEAGSLFVQRAQMILPRFEVTVDNAPAIAQICARLDGLPLAIELAAARCKMLSPQALLARLDSRLTSLTGGSRDAPRRQQTLRLTLDWSYNLLDEGEKKSFARLAVFQGGGSLEAIEVVCGHDLPMDVFDGLAALVDKSLIQQKEAHGGEPRFVMLETIHEYARERLAESGESDVIRRRYAEYFVELAERAEPELRLVRQIGWLQTLERERDNLRTVLEWSLAVGDVALGVRLAGALFFFWHAFGFHVEGYHWTRQLLERLDETPEKYRASFLICAGYMTWFRDSERAKLLLTRALEVARELGDRFHAAWALTYLSVMLPGEAGVSAAENGLSLFRELDHKPGIAHSLNVVGEHARMAGAYGRAKRAYQECTNLVEQTGDIRLFTAVLHNRALIAQHERDHEEAFALLRRSLVICRDIHHNNGVATDIQILAGSFGAVGEPERATRLLGAAEAILERAGTFLEPYEEPEFDRIVAGVRAQLGDAAFQTAWADGRAMTLEQAVAEALSDTA
ncbi:MAG: AAA family ATPase [Anaerolineae bacterium]|nr:AAA family ATPase [Anaerolineae bacterium]